MARRHTPGWRAVVAMGAGAVVALAGSGCGASMAGDWAGLCFFSSSGGYSANMEVFASIYNDNGSALEGEMTIRDWTGSSPRVGDLLGNRTGQYMELRGRFLSELGYYELELDAARSGSDLTGECAFRVPEGEGALLGTLEMTRAQ